MIAVTDILLAVVVFVAGFIGGRISRHTTTPKRASVTCDTCDHGRGFHTEGNGPCLAPVLHVDGVMLTRATTCKCQAWDGPTRPEDIIRDFQG